MSSGERPCAAVPVDRFPVTTSAGEDQHALAVAGRKFANLMPFGCWWFLNTPGLIAETTRTRLELLGPTFVPQHSDARVPEQLACKWSHGRAVTAAEVERAARMLLAENDERFRGTIGRPG